MTFQVDKTNRLLGEMSIENIFIEECLPRANGTYVKVFLLGLYYAKNQAELDMTNHDIADKLDIPLIDVINAWRYWESIGVVEIDKNINSSDDTFDFDINFVSLRQLLLGHNDRSSEDAITNKDVIESIQIPVIAMMYQKIDNIIMRESTPNDKRNILEWINRYKVDADVVAEAFKYSYEIKGKRSFRYVEGVIRNWSAEGVSDLNSLSALMEKKDVDFIRYQRVMYALGLQNKPYNQGDALKIKAWYYEMNFDDEMILKACEASSKVKSVSVNYINSILESWYSKGIKRIEDIEKLDVKTPDKKYSGSKVQRATGFSNFDGNTPMTDEQIREIERKQRESLLKRGE